MPNFLKCKIFQGFEPSAIEKEINTFFSGGAKNITNQLQSESFPPTAPPPIGGMAHGTGAHYTITVFYMEQ